jgi:hypothetical protein
MRFPETARLFQIACCIFSAREDAPEQSAIHADDDERNRTQSFRDNGTHSNNSPKLMSRQILVATSE